MKILQVSTLDVGGGAESVARGLTAGFRRLGHEALLAVGWKRGTYPYTVEIPRSHIQVLSFRLGAKIFKTIMPSPRHTQVSSFLQHWVVRLPGPLAFLR